MGNFEFPFSGQMFAQKLSIKFTDRVGEKHCPTTGWVDYWHNVGQSVG